jgi:uncharacterized protein YkwD
MTPRFNALLSLFVAASLVAAPASEAAPGRVSLPSPSGCKVATQAGISTARIEASLFCLHNRRRGGRGLGLLRRSADLRNAATRHARDMIRRRYFDHVSPDGKGPGDRVAATGYAASRGYALGENILFNGPRVPSPKWLMRQWLKSPGHRENILQRGWRDVGLAAVHGSPFGRPGGVTVVAVFGRRS